MYVGNLSFDATQEDLESLFSGHGTVKDVFILKDRDSGRPRGFAFVSMETVEEMNTAIEALNGEEFMGRNLAVNEARPREERGGGGGGFGDRRGGGGGGGGRRDFGDRRGGGGGGGGRRDYGDQGGGY